jgi:hemerythrin superfamily protein
MKTTNDALSLLIKDHKDVKEMFEQFDGLSDGSKATKKKVADQICQALTVHTQLEEKIFYPAVREAISDEDLIAEALVEHASAKKLIEQIQDMEADDDLYDAKVKVLSEQVEHHVREEEDEMFPKVRKTNLDISALGEKMMALKEQLNKV